MNLSWLLPRSRPLVVAHRGSSGRAPENTLTAFRLAREDGADAIELDVHLSGDGHVVVMHDRNIDRTTDGTGPVRNYTLHQLKKYNAASGWRGEFHFETIPTLEEVFADFGNTIGINIEIKRERTAKVQYELLRKCVSLIQEGKLYETVLVSSFKSEVVKEIGMLDRRINRGWLYDPLLHSFRSPTAFAKSLGVKYFILNHRILRKRTAVAVHKNDMLIGEFTVNTHRQIKRSLRYEIDAIITNFPSEVLTCLHRR